MGEQGFVPFGEWMPDARYLINSGLLTADGVVPVYGSYVPAPACSDLTADIDGSQAVARGLHVDRVTGNGYAWMDTTATVSKIYKLTEAGVVSNVSKAGNYGGGTTFAYGCNYGDTVIVTNKIAPVQYLPTGAALFADLITSTFAPKAALCFPLRNNLFLANCTLGAGYDGLPSGANPTLVAWSASDVPRTFGSFNADPQYIGAGYQQVNFDLGDITGAVAGADFAFLAHANGFSRIDGPPYTFRVVAQNIGCLYPYAMCTAGSDIYVVTQAGLLRFNGGDGRPDFIGAGKFIRALVDNATGFGAHSMSAGGDIGELSMAHDPINDLLFISYVGSTGGFIDVGPRNVLVYNIQEDRATWFAMRTNAVNGLDLYPALLRPGRNNQGAGWCPGRDIRFIDINNTLTTNKYAGFSLASSGLGIRLGKGFIQFKTGQTSRITRIRPIYAVSDQSAIEHISVIIDSTNKPYLTPTTLGGYTDLDSHGWITTPNTIFADFHAPTFILASNVPLYPIVEFKGFEYEIELGPVYAA